MTASTAYKCLAAGIDTLEFSWDCVPCDLLLTGEKAFPILVNPSGQVLLAASQYGKGRLVVLPHAEYLSSPKFSNFIQNSLNWLKPSPDAIIGIHPTCRGLENILLSMSMKVQTSNKLSTSFGVYCTDAFEGSQPKELIEFVKTGGGLFIGGTTEIWTAVKGMEDVLQNYPGNKVTGVAGIFFTPKRGTPGIYALTKQMPTTPLVSLFEIDFTRDLKLLVGGLSAFDLKTDDMPCPLLVHGYRAFSLCYDGRYQTCLAAARYGQGRIVVLTQEEQLKSLQLKPFIINALSWLDTGNNGKIGIERGMNAFYNLIIQEKFDCELSDLVPTLSVYCCRSSNKHDVEKTLEFVAEGGGLLITGQPWFWAFQNPGREALADYPGNHILNKVGISMLGVYLKPDTYKAVNAVDASLQYHFRNALWQLEQHLIDKKDLGVPLASWTSTILKDIESVLKIPAEDFPTLSSIQETLIHLLETCGIPRPSKNNRIKINSKESFLIKIATLLHNKYAMQKEYVPRTYKPFPQNTTYPTQNIEIDGTNNGCTAWRSTGLYISPETSAVLTFPSSFVAAGLQVQIGCHSDNLDHAEWVQRPPTVIQTYSINQDRISISSLWGGLLYIIVPSGTQLGHCHIKVEGALQAPFYQHGKTRPLAWIETVRHFPAPWAEMATENIIFTLPSDMVRDLQDPAAALSFWDSVMESIAELSDIPIPFSRPERIVADVQISGGFMHAGYPIMIHVESARHLFDVEHIRAHGFWGLTHELGHNQQKSSWEISPHTLEATCNLWSIYIHEKVLENFPRDRAHPQLQPLRRTERVQTYLKNGSKLEDWNTWTSLETYLQLQEGFGWEPFIQLFSDYQKISGIKSENAYKMNLWAEKFSQQVKRNLAPFFKKWGWPIEESIAQKLIDFPEWEDNPLKTYISTQS